MSLSHPQGGLRRAFGTLLMGSVLPWAQADTLPPLQLRHSLSLQEALDPLFRASAPSFLSGDRIQGTTDVQTTVEGDVELRRHDTVLRAGRLEHQLADNTVIASGGVRINRMGNVFEGRALTLQLDHFTGQFEQVRFSLRQNGAQGQASRVELLGEGKTVAHDVLYTTCSRPPQGPWVPDWVVTASSLTLDNESDTGTAVNGVIRFKDVPLLATPWISFPLSGQRKSGVLPPTINLDNQSGLEVTLPYYLNWAPNRDATLYPTVMSRRGLDLGGEFRYLEPTHAGTARLAYMANDALRDANRWGVSLQHQNQLNASGTGLRLNLNRVSDDDYWRDFPRSNTSLTQRLLVSEGVVSGGRGPWSWSVGAHAWQTLQDPLAPIVAPFDRMPSLSLHFAPGAFRLAGRDQWQARMDAELTRFEAVRSSNDNGTRALLTGQLKRQWRGQGWYMEPGAQVNLRHYRFDQARADGQTQTTLALPTLTLDSGLVFERPLDWQGQAMIQTLEPRLYYAWTPYQRQDMLPLYDTAAYDFNLATLFTPNPYGGQDRIADVHAVTLGLTSRWIDAGSGAEWLELGAGQRFRLSEQNVTLPGVLPYTETASDILLGARVNWNERWSASSTVQFNPANRESVRSTLSTHFTPGPFRTLNAAYRRQQTTAVQSEQVDVSWQWPMGELATALTRGERPAGDGRWYSVGRVNYSLEDRRVVDLVTGFEYDAGCWIGRMVLERLQQSTSEANQRILFQLEFNGFSRIGSSPLQTIRDNIPRYQYLRQDVTTPSRFESYE